MKVYESLQELGQWQAPLAVAVGIFDGMHRGHRKVIEAAVKAGKDQDLKTAVLTFSFDYANAPEGKMFTGHICSQSIFKKLVQDLGASLIVNLPFTAIRDMQPEDFVTTILKSALHASVISCGQDFRFGHGAKANWQDLAILGYRHDFQVLAQPLVMFGGEPISSTKIRHCIQQGNMPQANDLLGHRYAIDFEVVHGNQLGRTLGTPTINQPYPSDFIKPLFGVYATLARVANKWYTAVTNVGVKPTIGEYPVCAETYIQGFSGDLYGERVHIEFLQYLRSEVKFVSTEDLRKQILKDSRDAKMIGNLFLESLK